MTPKACKILKGIALISSPLASTDIAMDKYRRIPKAKADQSTIGENEIRILADWQRGARNYISYALNVLTAEVR